MKQNKKFWVGLDIGGTKLLSLVMDDVQHVIGQSLHLVGIQRNNDIITNIAIECIDASLRNAGISRSDVAGIGVAAAGIINVKEGTIVFTPNLHLSNLPLRDKLEAEFKVPALVENDGNAAAYGEFIMGAGQKMRHLIAIFIGTGVGAGIIINKQPYFGAWGCAGEIGHIVVQPNGHRCTCGKYGCLEAYVSRKSLAREMVALVAAGEAPTIRASVGADIFAISADTIQAAMKAGDPAVIELVQRSAYYLGIGMANCFSIFNPDMMILGGGLVDKLGTQYVKWAEESMRAQLLAQLATNLQVKQAQLGDNAVAIGGAALLRNSL